jgi:hypothetical protein
MPASDSTVRELARIHRDDDLGPLLLELLSLRQAARIGQRIDAYTMDRLCQLADLRAEVERLQAKLSEQS